eukprot:jgi/Galph1/5381/GphlegSOOS_G4011.1
MKHKEPNNYNSVRNVSITPSAEPDIPLHANETVQALWSLYAELWDEEMRNDPLSATMLGDYRFNAYLQDLSMEARQQHHQVLRDLQKKVSQLDVKALEPHSEIENYEYLKEMLRISLLSLETFDRYEIPTTHIFGPPVLLPMAANFHPWNNKEDTSSFLLRLQSFSQQVEQIIEAFRYGIHTSYTLPVESVDAMISICQAQVPNIVTDSPFYKLACPHFEKLIGNSDGLLQVIQNNIIPSYKKLADFLQQEYRDRARTTAGIVDWKDREKIYQGAIEYYTSLKYSAKELHEIGKQEVCRISKAIDDIRHQLNKTEGSLSSFIEELRKNKELYAKDAEDIIERYKHILTTIESKVLTYFETIPKAELQVKPIESYREKSAPPAHYYPAPEDRSRPAVFYANTSEPHTRPLFAMKSVALHEGIPGHHFQIAIAQELSHLPRIRKQAQGFCIGYIEGWGLYAEYLGEAMNVYENNYELLGRLLAEIWRACRLVVDTGLHVFGWSREQAVQYMRENAGIAEVDIQVEVDRYMVMPGQALAYKVGEMKIMELLNYAQTQLGHHFSWPSFHRGVLESGALPLSVLERKVRNQVLEQGDKDE